MRVVEQTDFSGSGGGAGKNAAGLAAAFIARRRGYPEEVGGGGGCWRAGLGWMSFFCLLLVVVGLLYVVRLTTGIR